LNLSKSSVADPGCLSLLPDPGSKNTSDPGSGSKNLSIFNPKIVSKLSEICTGMFIPDSDLDFLLIPDPGIKKGKAPLPGSATLFKRIEY
jgi:hypothetical protein